jgi:polyisoprenoid-binding protein YceI
MKRRYDQENAIPDHQPKGENSMTDRAIAIILSSFITIPSMASDTYTIDPAHTLPVFEVSHLGFSTQRGRFNQTSGKITLDLQKKSGHVSLTIAAESIDMGLAKWNEHLKSDAFFNTATFPDIIFKSDHFEFAGEKLVAAQGTLTLLGVTQPIRLDIKGFTCGTNPFVQKDLCAADIETHLKRSAFGMNRYLPGIGDDIHVLVPVEAFKD